MNYYTLSKKPKILMKSNAEGNTSVKCYDLLASKNTDINLDNFQVCVVTEYYVGRPDLISFVFYGTDVYGDIICKANDISNPFEMNIGDVLIIPTLYNVGNYIENGITDAASSLVSDDDNIESMSEDAYKKLKNESRSPNELTVGESNFVIDKSKHLIFY